MLWEFALTFAVFFPVIVGFVVWGALASSAQQ